MDANFRQIERAKRKAKLTSPDKGMRNIMCN